LIIYVLCKKKQDEISITLGANFDFQWESNLADEQRRGLLRSIQQSHPRITPPMAD